MAQIARFLSEIMDFEDVTSIFPIICNNLLIRPQRHLTEASLQEVLDEETETQLG